MGAPLSPRKSNDGYPWDRGRILEAMRKTAVAVERGCKHQVLSFANGRKRKCVILSLASEQGLVTEPGAIQELIYGFYRNLMGAEESKLLSTVQDLWPVQQRVSDQENEDLM
jgi:hypothetical protein